MENGLDKEWAELILYARDLGITIDEIREFLSQSSRPE
ncbi:DNA-binding anti-repressor SinI [Peribacillus asahii]|uniref:DNA-binding anti-repressor SinI n=1 Tax=Peribacillus asahii TaxID=228899 RepID=A0A398BEN5_9BACI|nr:DNA-binding anti-repressor SinI [Peribacillus asahii]